MGEMHYHRSKHRSWIVARKRLSLEEYGAYHLLCMHMYELGTPLPNNLDVLKNLLEVPSITTAKRLRDAIVLAGLFSISQDNMIHNGKTDRELAKFAEKRAKISAKPGWKSAENQPASEPKSAANSTRAYDRAGALNPESRTYKREESSLSGGTASARTFQGSLIADLLKHRKETNHEPDPEPDQRQIPPSDRR